MIDKSDLYIPPKDWKQGTDAWYSQVEFVMNYTREKIAQAIMDEFETERNYWLAESPTVHREFSIFKKCADIARGKNE